MPNITPEGIRVPAGGDNYDLTNDLRKMMESATTIVPVANIPARAALVAALVAAGRPPTTADPLYVDRADAPANRRLERSHDGTSWSPIVAGDTGWIDATLVGGWSNLLGNYSPTRYRLMAGQVYLEIAIKLGTLGAFTLPPEMRPGKILSFLGTANGGIADLRIYPTGTVEVAGFYAGGTGASVLATLNFAAVS